MGLCCWADRKTFRLRSAMVLVNVGSVRHESSFRGFDVVHGKLGIVEYFDISTINRTSFSSPRKQPPAVRCVGLFNAARTKVSDTCYTLKSAAYFVRTTSDFTRRVELAACSDSINFLGLQGSAIATREPQVLEAGLLLH
jgi:hypothetical protein